MGLFKRLNGDRSEQEPRDTPESRTRDGLKTLNDSAKSEYTSWWSHYQPAIRACSWKPSTDTLFHCTAELVPKLRHERLSTHELLVPLQDTLSEVVYEIC